MTKENENSEIVLENTLSLKQFPPKLRKLAKYMLENEEIKTVSGACRDLDFNIQSIFTMIHRTKQNGNDFNEFIREQSNNILNTNRLAVYNRLSERAVSDSSTSHNDRKTFFQLTGDLKETANINIGSLTIGVNVSNVMPQDLEREKGVIDVEPVIPKGK